MPFSLKLFVGVSNFVACSFHCSRADNFPPSAVGLVFNFITTTEKSLKQVELRLSRRLEIWRNKFLLRILPLLFYVYFSANTINFHYMWAPVLCPLLSRWRVSRLLCHNTVDSCSSCEVEGETIITLSSYERGEKNCFIRWHKWWKIFISSWFAFSHVFVFISDHKKPYQLEKQSELKYF